MVKYSPDSTTHLLSEFDFSHPAKNKEIEVFILSKHHLFIWGQKTNASDIEAILVKSPGTEKKKRMLLFVLSLYEVTIANCRGNIGYHWICMCLMWIMTDTVTAQQSSERDKHG